MARTDGEWWLHGGTIAVDVEVPAPRPATPIAAARLAGSAFAAGVSRSTGMVRVPAVRSA